MKKKIKKEYIDIGEITIVTLFPEYHQLPPASLVWHSLPESVVELGSAQPLIVRTLGQEFPVVVDWLE